MRDRLISLRDRAVAWVMWSPARLTAVLVTAVAVVVASVLLGAIAGSRGGPSQDAARPDGSLHAQDLACRDAVARWGAVFSNPKLGDAEWIPQVRRYTTARASAWVPMTDRELVPRGPIRITSTNVMAQSCEATVTFANRTVWVVDAVPDTGSRWAVDAWDDGT